MLVYHLCEGQDSIDKLKLIFIVSVVVIAVSLFLVVYLLPSDSEYASSRSIQVIEGEDEWILQCDITNTSDTDETYNILIEAQNTVRRDSAVVGPGRTYTYTCHISRNELETGQIKFSLYLAGKPEPLEQKTFYVKDE